MGARPRLPREYPHLQFDGAARDHGLERVRELVDRPGVVALLRERLGPGEDRLRAGAVVAGDAGPEERRVDPEAQRQPFDGLAGRARLAPLDLRDVLLREP